MTIYVDELVSYDQQAKPGLARRYFGDKKESCHMTTDEDVEALHQFAMRLFKKSHDDVLKWFQQDHANPLLWHYDLTPPKRRQALKLGAVPGSAWRVQELGIAPPAPAPSLWGDALPDAVPYTAPERRIDDKTLLGRVVHDGLNPCVKVYGAGPADVTCKDCVFLVRGDYHNKTYTKCLKRGLTHGPGTDHKLRYPACAKFSEAWDEDECCVFHEPHEGEPEWCQICDIPLCSGHMDDLKKHPITHTLEELYEERERRSRGNFDGEEEAS